MSNNYVTFTDVVREYKTDSVSVRAADGISFSLEQGKFSIIVGPSGAGKTTVLNILGGMDAVTSGTVSVDNRDISRLSKRDVGLYRRNDVGFVFQFYNLIPNLTALENIELASQIRKDALDPRTVLNDVGLGHRLDNFPAQLSGGEQQRVAIARALTKNPKLLLCDEPTVTSAWVYSPASSMRMRPVPPLAIHSGFFSCHCHAASGNTALSLSVIRQLKWPSSSLPSDSSPSGVPGICGE